MAQSAVTLTLEKTRPFEYEVNISPSAVRIGDEFVIQYRLTNTSDASVTACAREWESYQFTGSRGSSGLKRTGDHGTVLMSVPPKMTLSWKIEGRMPDVGEGTAHLFGEFHSDCGLRREPVENGWSGILRSPQIKFTVLLSRDR
jgi:hypothetical protein